MGAPRFSRALMVACGAHAGLALGFAVAPPPPSTLSARPEPVDELELTREPSEPPLVAEPVSSSPALAVAIPAHASPPPHRPPPAQGVASSPDLPEPTEPVLAAPATSASRAPAVDLGLGDYWKTIALERNAAPTIPPVDSSGGGLDDGMRADLRDHDRALGLGSGGPIVAAAHEAASPAIAPDTGDAVFDVECDASGANVTARVVSAGGDLGEWNAVARELVRQMAAKRIRVPKGARGLPTRVQIVAERTLPAGNRPPPPTAGAVPDDVPGGEKVCEGSGWERKCLKGMPGVTATVGDLSNIAAKRSRIVRVHVLGETPL